MSEIIPKLLHMSGVWDVPETENFRPRLVINLTEQIEDSRSIQAESMIHWAIEDGDLPDTTMLHAVVDFVVAAVRAGLPTLVHCHAGLNRSGLVTALALTELLGIDGNEAIEKLRIIRGPYVLCNRHFETYVMSIHNE